MTDTPDDSAPSVEITPQRWLCCHCGGTGIDSYGPTCPHCKGLGFC